MPKTKKVSIEIESTREALADRNITLEELTNVVKQLARFFGTKYPRIFPIKIRTEHLNRLLYVSKTLASIEAFKGFKRHINEYNKNNIEDHLFTAKTATWLSAKGFDVELEPLNGHIDKKHPDICCTDSPETLFYIECKRIRKEKFFDFGEKKRLADLVYQKVQTCDQITIYLDNSFAAKSLERRMDDQAFAINIHKAGSEHAESSIEIVGEFKINIIRKPTIIGAENDHLTAVLEMVMEGVSDGERLPGYAFVKGGRSVGVFGPPPDYSSIWNRKRSKSKKQSIPGNPFIVMICGEDVLGNPKDHSSFFERVWLTSENAEVSAVGILSFATSDGVPKLNYFENPNARYPLRKSFLKGR